MKKFVYLTLLLAANLAVGQVCYDSDLVETTATDDFVVDDSVGTVLHIKTGLMWSRCNLGQIWQASSKTCSGVSSQITWQEALLLAEQSTLASYDDWRLPNVKELATLVERSCVDPAMNISLFPSALAENYWTATSQNVQTDYAWSYAFYSGKNNLKQKHADLFARIVRFAQ